MERPLLAGVEDFSLNRLPFKGARGLESYAKAHGKMEIKVNATIVSRQTLMSSL